MLLGPKQVAFKLGVSVRTLEDWRAQNKGPAYTVLEGRIRYDSDDLEAYLARNKVDPQKGQYRFPFKVMIERELAARKRLSEKRVALSGMSGLPQNTLFAI